MAFGIALFGDSADPSLPDKIQPNTRGVDTAFERFIDGALTKLYNESSARTEDGRALRASTKPLLGAGPVPPPPPTGPQDTCRIMCPRLGRHA